MVTDLGHPVDLKIFSTPRGSAAGAREGSASIVDEGDTSSVGLCMGRPQWR
eukprot:CAMPEP_0174744210 /NCGR_PEP_ID=MMETSP1094-20130205/83639_1 /TAXON_ID=156173 /ORGANISM="Chrysochromulina brevifilum, Strain UTEX LB 985" /LENGTH=50 /DNA_ID=CAMNT_0015948553 /DNA_START=61 /DNA_END=210 /DNA_ORIENTATION=+